MTVFEHVRAPAQGLPPGEYERKKAAVADALIARVEAALPGLSAAALHREVGTPRTHRRFLNREDGSYGPIPSRRPFGMLGMPFNRTAVKARSLYAPPWLFIGCGGHKALWCTTAQHCLEGLRDDKTPPAAQGCLFLRLRSLSETLMPRSASTGGRRRD